MPTIQTFWSYDDDHIETRLRSVLWHPLLNAVYDMEQCVNTVCTPCAHRVQSVYVWAKDCIFLFVCFTDFEFRQTAAQTSHWRSVKHSESNTGYELCRNHIIRIHACHYRWNKLFFSRLFCNAINWWAQKELRLIWWIDHPLATVRI